MRPAAESAISADSRRSRVSGRFALVTQWVAYRRSDGASSGNQAQARRFGLEALLLDRIE